MAAETWFYSPGISQSPKMDVCPYYVSIFYIPTPFCVCLSMTHFVCLCVWLYIPTQFVCVWYIHTMIWPVDVLHLSDCVLLSSLWNDSLRNTWPLEILYIEFFWYCSRVFLLFPFPLWHVQFIYACASPMHVRELHVHYSMHDVRSY